MTYGVHSVPHDHPERALGYRWHVKHNGRTLSRWRHLHHAVADVAHRRRLANH